MPTPLPEAQLDRFFFKCMVPFPSRDQLVEISRRTTGTTSVPLEQILDGEAIRRLRIWCWDSDCRAADGLCGIFDPGDPPRRGPGTRIGQTLLVVWIKPRGMQALIRGARVRAILAGRTAVSVADIKRLLATLRHRIILNFEGEAESVPTDRLVDDILAAVATPPRTLFDATRASKLLLAATLELGSLCQSLVGEESDLDQLMQDSLPLRPGPAFRSGSGYAP